MQHQSLFVFDIETIPDTDAVPNLTNFEGVGVEERREELDRYHLEITKGQNAFPRQPFHKVVAISFVEAEIQRDGNGENYLLREVRSGGEVGSNEKELVTGFFKYLERLRPRLVSYNGRGFDLPVLKFRAMKHGIDAAWLYQSGDKWNSYTSRYSADWHCDLQETLTDYGAASRGLKLNEVCSVMGFPGKFGVDGSKVTEMYDGGQVDEIRNYCETDVLNTYLVYLRSQYHTGALSKEGYNRSVQDAVTFLGKEGENKPYLGDFLLEWEKACDGKFALD